MNNISKSSKILVLFLLFSFLFATPTFENQAFAVHEEIKLDYSLDREKNNPQADEPPGKEGIDEDWMFGKINLIESKVLGLNHFMALN